MPEITNEQASLLDAISNAVRGTSSSFTQQQSRTDTPSSQTSKQSVEDKSNRIRAQKAAKSFEEATKLFNKSVNKEYKTKEEWKLQVEQSKTFMNSAVASIQQSNIGMGATSGLEAMFNTEKQLDVLTEIREGILKDAQNKYGKELPPEVTAQIEQQLRQVGLKFEDIGEIQVEYASVMEEVNGEIVTTVKELKYGLVPNLMKMDETTKDVTKDLKKASDGLERLATTSDNMRKATQGAFAAAGVTAKMFVDESRIAMRRGVADARDGFGDTAAMIMKLGISTSKYMELLAENRNIQLAMTSAGKSWKDQLVDTTNELMSNGFTGSMEEAAIAAAGFMKNTARMGVAQNELENAVSNQTKIYEKNFRALAISTDQFNALTEDMLNDVDIKKDLAKLQGRERQAYVESLQRRTAENVMMGYSIERAKELNKHFAKISEEDPLQRLETAAKIRTGLGAVGMGDQGALLQQLMAKLPTLDGDEKVDAQKQITSILAEAQTRFQELKGRDVGSNVAYGQIEAQLGLKELLTMFQTELREGTRIAKEGETAQQALVRLSEEQKKRGEVDNTTMLGVRAVDTFQAAATSSATVAATMLGSYIFAGGLQKSMGITEGLLTKIATAGPAVGGGAAGGGKFGKLAKGAGAAALLYGAWETGSAIGDAITDSWKGTDSYESFSDGLGKSVDFFAQIFSKDAEVRMMDAAERKKYYDEQRAANTAKLKQGADQIKASSETGKAVAAGTEQSTKNSEKILAEQDKNTRMANQRDGNPTTGSPR